MVTKTLNDLFIHALSDIYSAEKQLTKALSKQARASTSPNLKMAFEAHLHETIARFDATHARDLSDVSAGALIQ